MNLKSQIDSGQIALGNQVVETEHISFSLDNTTNTILNKKQHYSGRQVPLKTLREVLLRDHCKLGLVRIEDNSATTAQATASDNRQCTRHLKIWHDHGPIAGHGHLLVMVACIYYDEQFYYTNEEMKTKGVTIDVPTYVERPAIHILARSTSTLEDQAKFCEFRLSCIKEVHLNIATPKQHAIRDIVRFFHGDRPAQQFEAGHNQGGNYPCTMCKAKAECFDDITYCNRSDIVSLADRQQFVLTGKTWKDERLKPYDKLSIATLRKELHYRGQDTGNKRRPELQRDFEKIRAGISTFPALLLPQPESTLTELNLSMYEVAAVEALHDIKGHMSHIIEEILCLLTKQTAAHNAVTLIKQTVLNKETLRCADFRKAAILLSQGLKETSCGDDIKQLVNTAVEIFQIFYSNQHKRTPRTILRLHNLAYKHALLCTKLFSTPKSNTRRAMFGMYYHSITCHSPKLYRIIALKSLNTEFQERTFGQAKNIT